MKGFLRLILFLPRLILRLIWNLIWGFIQTAIVLVVIGLGILWYVNHSNSTLANNLSNIISNAQVFFNSNSGANWRDSLSNLATDSYTAHGARWSSNQATVYIKSTDPTFVSAYQTALANWNATGVFTFTLVGTEAEADIIATDYNDSSSQAAGLAETQTNALTNTITHVDVYLNSYYLLDSQYGYDFDRITHTAEHELGHAIGLEHDDAETSVMQSSGSYHGIQQTDIEAVRTLYSS